MPGWEWSHRVSWTPKLVLVCLLIQLCHLHPSAEGGSGREEVLKWGQDLPGRPLLLRGGKNVHLEVLPQVYGPHRRKDELDSSTRMPYIVRAQRESRAQLRSQLQALLDYRRMHYIPMDSWLVRMSGAEVAAVQDFEGTIGVYGFPSALKIAYNIQEGWQKQDPGRRIDGKSRAVLDVLCFLGGKGEPLDRPNATAMVAKSVEKWRQILLGGEGKNETGATSEEEDDQRTGALLRRFVIDIRQASDERVTFDVLEEGVQKVSEWLSRRRNVLYIERRLRRLITRNVLKRRSDASDSRDTASTLGADGKQIVKPAAQLRDETSEDVDDVNVAGRKSAGNGLVDASEGISATRNQFAVPAVLGGRGGDGLVWLWKHGLTGRGEVVGVADTGVDFDSCFFYDADHPIAMPAGRLLFSTPKHRKLPFYRLIQTREGVAAPGDAVDGHGTHVAGVIVGRITASGDGRDELRKYEGVAPDAQLFIDDCSDDVSEDLRLPDSLKAHLWPAGYDDGGVRVHSNSWGDESEDYSLDAREADEFMYDHQDFLIVVAAGNTGPNLMSVGSPANAKNVLAVGASENSPYAYPLDYSFYMRIDGATRSEVIGQQLRGLAAAFGPRFRYAAALSSAKVVGVQSEGNMACQAPANAEALRGNVALIKRGTCFFKEKVRHAQEAGAIAAIITNSRDEANFHQGPLTMGNTGEVQQKILIPSVCVGSSDGELLWREVDEGEYYDHHDHDIDDSDGDAKLALLLTLPLLDDELPFSMDNIAQFSSSGPTYDHRFKPDILAPGEAVTSSRSDGALNTFQCGVNPCEDDYALSTMSGTSMATPLVAGAAAIVRQYFREGNGRLMNGISEPLVKASFEPSAALIKAVILHSGRKLVSAVERLRPGPAFLPPPHINSATLPSYWQGYGAMDISRVLWIDGALPGPAKLRIADGERVHDGGSKRYCVSLPLRNPGEEAFEPLAVTLVWTDPAALSFSDRALINDLNLQVVGPGGKLKVGNKMVSNFCIVSPEEKARGKTCDDESSWNLRHDYDAYNNVESVRWREYVAGKYLIEVVGHDVPEGPQTFALVVTGGRFTVLPEDQCSSLSGCGGNGCGAYGSCVLGRRCQCMPTHSGLACDVANHVLVKQPLHTYAHVHLFQWVYFVWEVNADSAVAGGSDWAIQVSLAINNGQDPDLYVAWNRLPALDDYDFRDIRGSLSNQVITSKSLGSPRATGKGFWVLGIFAYCCNDARVRVRLSDGNDLEGAGLEPSIEDEPPRPAPALPGPSPSPTPPPAATSPVLESGVTLELTMLLSKAEFDMKRSSFLQAIAKAAGVEVSSVWVISVRESTIGRRGAGDGIRRILSVVAASAGLSTSASVSTRAENSVTVVTAIASPDPAATKAALTPLHINSNLQASGLPEAFAIRTKVVIPPSKPAAEATSSPDPAAERKYGPFSRGIVVIVGIAGVFIFGCGAGAVVWLVFRRYREVRQLALHDASEAMPLPLEPRVGTGGTRTGAPVTVMLTPVRGITIADLSTANFSSLVYPIPDREWGGRGGEEGVQQWGSVVDGGRGSSPPEFSLPGLPSAPPLVVAFPDTPVDDGDMISV